VIASAAVLRILYSDCGSDGRNPEFSEIGFSTYPAVVDITVKGISLWNTIFGNLGLVGRRL
jgi:hypothetical protein